MTDTNKRLEDLEELLSELKPYTGFILDLFEQQKARKTFLMMKYKDAGVEEYYNEIVALNKIINIIRFILK